MFRTDAEDTKRSSKVLTLCEANAEIERLKKEEQSIVEHLKSEVARLTRECLGRDCDVCGAELPAEKWRQCAACAEKAELAGLRKQVRWIPVEEQLPERGEIVLVLWSDGQREIDWLLKGGSWYAVPASKEIHITHWMQLPEARAALESTTPQEEQ